ncbi:MAG TPA: hypothetical protein PKW90_03765 [Myxococcota bacterium]|nr:hypothetical protein [Myxococcota bacterium]
MVILLFLACPAEPEPAPTVELLPLEAPLLARRMSIDLRGVLPSIEELDRVEADPSTLTELREQWLGDPLFEERLVELYQEGWGTRVDEFRGYYFDFDLPETENYHFLRAIGEEPLRVAARVVAQDFPYSELVTADWTMANPMLAEIFPIDRPEGDSEWVPSTYTDQRPSAGILTTNGLWWRYISPINNYNRARTAAVLDLLVCEDLLSRPVVFSAALSTAPSEVAEAVREEPACLACHATVEPIAATFFGFLDVDDQSAREMSRYHPEREHEGVDTLGVETAWYGEPVNGLEELGRAIGRDSRFVDCGVQTMAEGMLRRPVEDSDVAMLRDAREAVVDSGLQMKAALRVITDSPAYQAGKLGSGTGGESQSTRRILVATQLRSILRELSGFVWQRGGAEQLDWDQTGFRVMGGSVDGDLLSAPQQTPGLTWALLTRRTAQMAARSVADQDLGGSSPRLLLGVDRSTRPGDPAFDAQLSQLYWRLLAQRADAPTREALSRLWSESYAVQNSTTDAWGAVLTVLLRDPEFLTY